MNRTLSTAALALMAGIATLGLTACNKPAADTAPAVSAPAPAAESTETVPVAVPQDAPASTETTAPAPLTVAQEAASEPVAATPAPAASAAQ